MERARRYRFSTAAYRGEQAFDAWRRQQLLFELHCSERDIGLRCEFDGSNLDGLLVGRCVARIRPGQFIQARREAPLLNHERFDHYYFHLCLGGSVELTTDRGHVRARQGQIVVADMTQPSHWIWPRGRAAMLMVPRERLPAQARSMHGMRLDADRYPLLPGYLRAIAHHQDRWPASGANWLSHSLTALLTAYALGAPDAAEARGGEPSLHRQRRRVEDYIRAHLQTAELGPAQIARELGVSRSVLYRIFAADGGVRRFLQELRLQAAQRELCASPAQARPRLGDVAWRYGFASASQFSHSYRRRFGHPPRDEARHPRLAAIFDDNAATATGDGVGANGAPTQDAANDFRGWIRSARPQAGGAAAVRRHAGERISPPPRAH